MRIPAAAIRTAIQQNLQQITTTGLRRARREISASSGAVANIDGHEVINFCSNDYLGLSHHPALIETMKQGLDRYGVGSGASPLISGHTSAHKNLEEAVAAFTGRERAITFSSGYQANAASINAFIGRSDLIAGDRMNHASLIDAALLTGARLKRYQHAEPAALDKILREASARKKLVVTDAVFSMDGDIAPLPQLAELCESSGAWLMVDDAHGFGVLGDRGGGTLQYFGLENDRVPLLMATFGKALGTSGAFVAGDHDIIEHLLQSARPYIYSTAAPPALAMATTRALELIVEEPWRRKHLFALVNRYRQGAQQLGLPVMDSITPIQPLILGPADRAVSISRELFERGIYVAAIRPPTVPQNSSRLRITLTAAHTEVQVDRLLESLSKLL